MEIHMEESQSPQRAMLHNLRIGMRIALFRPFDPAQLRTDARQIVLLILVAFALGLLSDFIHVSPKREFNAWGVISHLATYLLFLLSVYLVAQIQGRVEQLALLAVALLATEPVGQALVEMYRALFDISMVSESSWMAWSAYVLLISWSYAVCFWVQRHVFFTTLRRTALATTIYISVFLLNSFTLPHAQVWYTAYAEDKLQSRQRVDVEETYYAQPELLKAALENLKPQRPGIPDIYFVGMAGWAEQDVFLREVRSVRQLFDARFDTEGRSLLLINNPTTVADAPLANASNLSYVLNHVAELMDPEEDILFLYVTSHGSKEHEVAMSYWPLSLNDISAERLREILDASAIRWRAVVLSACYSGGFIQPLQDPRTMVLTASAADRQSFGCANENAWTYFGEAYFDKALTHTYSFTTAFQDASRAIAEREVREKLEPSLPQSWVGETIAEYLPRLENRLAALHSDVPQLVSDCAEGKHVASASLTTCR
jgi:hypothetical protein